MTGNFTRRVAWRGGEAVVGRVGDRVFRTRYALGERVVLCGDRAFQAVVVKVEISLGGEPQYLLRWRDRFDFTESWFAAGDIEALAGLEE